MTASQPERSPNVVAYRPGIGPDDRAQMKAQRPAIIWLTGLSGAGKSTVADVLDRLLHASGKHAYILDGDNLRHGLNGDLGFTEADRIENIRRVSEVARLMADAGLIVIVCLISPFRAERQRARALVREDDFIEVFIDTPIGECMARDPKGLYKKALAGEIKNFTGISSRYEAPQTPELHLTTIERTPLDLARQIEVFLIRRDRTSL